MFNSVGAHIQLEFRPFPPEWMGVRLYLCPLFSMRQSSMGVHAQVSVHGVNWWVSIRGWVSNYGTGGSGRRVILAHPATEE
jgi:hypothetical protein